MRKFLTFLFLFVLVFGAALSFLKDQIVKAALVSYLEGLTGFDVEARTLHLDPLQGTIYAKDLVLFNPEGFKGKMLADAPELYLRLDFPTIKQRTHIYQLKLDIRELNIEKNEAGISNISLLFSRGKSKKKDVARGSRPMKRKRPFYLERFELTLRKVRYEDRSSLIPQKVSLDLAIEGEVFEGIEDPHSIVNLILLKALARSPLGNFGLNPAELQDKLKTTMKTALDVGGKVIKETGTELAEKTQVVGRKMVGEGKETFDQVKSAAKEEVTDLFGKVRSKLGP